LIFKSLSTAEISVMVIHEKSDLPVFNLCLESQAIHVWHSCQEDWKFEVYVNT